MKKSKFSPTRIVGIRREFENGATAEDLSRKHGISTATLYSWRRKYSGMEASDLKRLKELETENAELKRMYAELALDVRQSKNVVEYKI